MIEFQLHKGGRIFIDPESVESIQEIFIGGGVLEDCCFVTMKSGAFYEIRGSAIAVQNTLNHSLFKQ